MNALDTAHTALTRADDQVPSYSTYDEAVHISFRGECHLKLGEAEPAVSYAQQSLKLLDRSSARDVAMTIVDLVEAYVQCTEIDEAAWLLGDAGDIAAGHSSVRLIGRLEQARACATCARSSAASPMASLAGATRRYRTHRARQHPSRQEAISPWRAVARQERAHPFVQRTSAGHAKIDVTDVGEALEILDGPAAS